MLEQGYRAFQAQDDVVGQLLAADVDALHGLTLEAFPRVVAVDWTLPAADPLPGLELPVIDTLAVTVV